MISILSAHYVKVIISVFHMICLNCQLHLTTEDKSFGSKYTVYLIDIGCCCLVFGGIGEIFESDVSHLIALRTLTLSYSCITCHISVKNEEIFQYS